MSDLSLPASRNMRCTQWQSLWLVANQWHYNSMHHILGQRNTRFIYTLPGSGEVRRGEMDGAAHVWPCCKPRHHDRQSPTVATDGKGMVVRVHNTQILAFRFRVVFSLLRQSRFLSTPRINVKRQWSFEFTNAWRFPSSGEGIFLSATTLPQILCSYRPCTQWTHVTSPSP